MQDFIKCFNHIRNMVPGLADREVITAFSQVVRDNKCIGNIKNTNIATMLQLMDIVKQARATKEENQY